MGGKSDRKGPGRADAGRLPSGLLRHGGLALLLVATAASAAMTVKHFGGRVPGCGDLADCDALEASAWGSIPVIHWPVAFLGLAWFAGLSAAWIALHGVPSVVFRRLALLGAFGSLVLTGVMLGMGKFCPYCAVTHAANLSFVIIVELAVRRRMGSAAMNRDAVDRIAPRRALVAGAATFLLVSAGLMAGEGRQQATRAAAADRERTDFVEKAVTAATATPDPVDRWGAAGFTGRWRLGPEAAPIRIVIYTDYQCPDCASIEYEIEQVLAAHPEASLSVKHFPMNAECNRHVLRTLHSNACWAARAAESAGILGGDDAYFAMHRWLFEVGGRFETTDDLAIGVRRAGLDPATFAAVMEGPETLRRVQEDIDEAKELGLFFTPMIFINGVELKWTFDPTSSVTRTVADLAARKLPARTAAADRPPLAAQKHLEDWQQQKIMTLPADVPAWIVSAGSTSDPIEIVMFGDYQEKFTAETDADIRRAIAGLPPGASARYTFRHYPVNRDCNPALPEKLLPSAVNTLACRAARAAEAAGRLGGDAAYGKMHEWLLANRAVFSDEAVVAQAVTLGLDAAEFRAAMDAPQSARAIASDCEAARTLGLTSVPTVYVAGRRVPRIQLDGASVLPRILEVAAREGK